MTDPTPFSDQALEAEFRLFFASETALTVGPPPHTIRLAVAWARHLLNATKPTMAE